MALAKQSQFPLSAPRVGVATAVTPNGSWTTYHHDDAHTGYDPTAPAVGSVTPTSGWTETTLDGEIYAEPLIYNGIVYAATLNDTVYALNQSDGTQIWNKNVGAPQNSGWVCGNVTGGILSTPVIDIAANRIYVVAEIAGATPTYHLFGLDLSNSGNIVLDTPISPTGFDWKIEQQRGALAVRNGFVYVPIGGRAGDCYDGSTPYHGYVVGVSTSGVTTLAVYTTPDVENGIWAAGGIVVDDSNGHVFAVTGNGGCPASYNYNDAVIRFSNADLSDPTVDYFAPLDWHNNWSCNDQDLGSTSPVLINSNLVFTAGKWGGGFLVNPNNLGGIDGQLFPSPKPATYSQANVCFGNTNNATFGSFAYAAPFVYLECEGHGLVALNVNTSTPSFSPCDAVCAAPDWSAGGATTFGPPIVAGGAVWMASNGGGLYAFNATTGVQIYHSAGFGMNRFVTPAEAGGQVFVPSHTVMKSFSFAPPPPSPYVVGVVGADPELYVLHSGSPSFNGFGGVLLGAPAVVAIPQTSGPAVPLYIATGSDHALWVRNDTRGWQILSGNPTNCIDNPAAGVIGGLLYVACEGPDHALWHAETAAPTGTNLPALNVSSWRLLGGQLNAGPAVANVAGIPTYVVVGSDTHVYFRDLTTPSFRGFTWTCIGHPALAAFGTTAYFACHGSDGALWYSTNTGSGWSSIQPLGGQLVDGVAIAATAAGPIFFAQGVDGALYQTTVSSGWKLDGGQVRLGVGACGL
jgi:outer membrane protein assembly factor BamB